MSQCHLKNTDTLRVIVFASGIQRRRAPPTAARVCASGEMQLDAVSVAVLSCFVNWRNAVSVALVDVAASIQQQLEGSGVTVLRGKKRRGLL